VRGTTALLERGDERGETRLARQRPVFDRLIDARQVLHDHAAGADVHVATSEFPIWPLGSPTNSSLACK